MTNKSKMTGTMLAILLLALTFTLGPTSAQDEGPYYPSTLIIHVTAALSEPPIIDMLPDNWLLFRANPTGSVTGELEGTFSQRITQLVPCASCEMVVVDRLEPITAFFVIETDEGSIEGYYSGAFYATEESFPDNFIRAHGKILYVTAAYADLYLADVYYDAIVDLEEVDGSLVPLGDTGTMVLAPTGVYLTQNGD